MDVADRRGGRSGIRHPLRDLLNSFFEIRRRELRNTVNMLTGRSRPSRTAMAAEDRQVRLVDRQATEANKDAHPFELGAELERVHPGQDQDGLPDSDDTGAVDESRLVVRPRAAILRRGILPAEDQVHTRTAVERSSPRTSYVSVH